MRETIGDIDILRRGAPRLATRRALMAAFTALPGVAEVIASGRHEDVGPHRAAGLQVDLRVVPPDSWGAALQYFTGSQAHNVRTREIAVREKLKLSEYGLFDVESGELIVSRTEEEMYRRLGMAWMPPTLREDGGEIEAALRGELPDLVTGERHPRRPAHAHQPHRRRGLAGGHGGRRGAARGYEYYAITDHAPNLVMQRMTDEKMLAQREQVRRARRRRPPPAMTLLHGTELNIGPDGDGGLAGRVPGRLRRLRGLGALALRPAAGAR